jgi:uncharacterized damage-inducible protein DinB
MPHPLVDQFRFTRHEWQRGLVGVSAEEATRHFESMNSISWIVGHMAWHEQRSWLQRPQGKVPYPKLNELYAYGAPMSTPVLGEMLEIWKAVTLTADPFLDGLTTAQLQTDMLLNGESVGQTIGSLLRRVTYHYWYHIGEIQAIRQLLGHRDLPEYVGDIEIEAPYRPE